jgi:hypothetical protein
LSIGNFLNIGTPRGNAQAIDVKSLRYFIREIFSCYTFILFDYYRYYFLLFHFYYLSSLFVCLLTWLVNWMTWEPLRNQEKGITICWFSWWIFATINRSFAIPSFSSRICRYCQKFRNVCALSRLLIFFLFIIYYLLFFLCLFHFFPFFFNCFTSASHFLANKDDILTELNTIEQGVFKVKALLELTTKNAGDSFDEDNFSFYDLMTVFRLQSMFSILLTL